MPRTNRVFSVLSVLLVVALVLPLVGCGAKPTPTVPPPYQAQPTTPPEPTSPPEPTTAPEATTAPEPTAVPEPTEAPREKVTVAYVPVLQFAALYVAEGRGIFDELGLDVEYTSVRSGTEAVAFLAEGSVDVGAIAVVASTWNAFAQGFDLRVVAPAALKPMKDDPSVLIVRKDLWDSGEVKTAADLKGLTVAVAGGPGSGGEYLVAKALEPVGLTIFDVDLQNIGNPDMAAALESGAIDAALTGSPYANQIEEAGYGVVLVKDMAPGVMTVTYIYSGNFMKERPEVAEKFTLGLMEASRLMQGDDFLSEENIAAYLQFVSSTEEAIKAAPPAIYDPNLTLATDTLLDLQRIHMMNGRLEYDTPLAVEDVVDPTWVETALDELGRWELPPLSPAEKVTVAYVPVLQFAAMYVAEGRGIFDELGLDVEYTSVRSGTEAVAFLAEGSVDVGAIAVVASTWNAFAEGFDLRVVAPAAVKPMKDDPSVLLVRKDLWDSGEVKTAADLAGRIVAVAGGPGSGGEYLVAKALEPVGLTIFDVDLQNIGNPDMAAALESGAIDAALTGSPYATQIEEAGYGVVLVKDMAPGVMTVTYVFSGKFMEERPEVALRFTVGLMEASRLMQGDDFLSEGNIGAYLQFVSSTEEAIKAAPPAIYPPDLTLATDTLLDLQRIHMMNGRLEYDTPLQAADVVDPSWVMNALRLLGPYEK